MDFGRTDLAAESRELHRDVPGVTERVERRAGALISDIRVSTEAAAKALDKPVGRYLTIDVPGIASRDPEAFQTAASCVGEALSSLLAEHGVHGDVLVLGLGNRQVTPDSLGPRTVERVFVTRHIREHAPELAPKGLRAVSAFSPGVLGVTGIETLEAVRGVTARVRPAAVLVVDALASLRAERISAAVQLNDTGIRPGAGVGNRQDALDQESLGLPVLALGVPTVVRAATIVLETLSALAQNSGAKDEAIEQTVLPAMRERFGDMIVTPKDVDRMVLDAAGFLAEGINRALHAPYYVEIEALLR